MNSRETVAGRIRPPERSGDERTGGHGRTRCASGRRHGHSHPRHRRKPGAARPARLSERRAVRRSARGQRPAKRPARIGSMAQQPAESAHVAGHRQPCLAPPVWRGTGQNGRQLRRQRRRAVTSRVAGPPGDAVPPRRLVDQEARAIDRADAGLPDEFEHVAGEPGGRSGEPARLASLSAPARRGGNSRRHLGRCRRLGFVASAGFAGDESAGHRIDEQRGTGPTADRACPQQPSPQYLSSPVARTDAQFAGSLRFCRAGHGHGRPRHDHRRTAGPVPAQRSVCPVAIAGPGRPLATAAEIGRRAANRLGLSPGVRPPGDHRRNQPRSDSFSPLTQRTRRKCSSRSGPPTVGRSLPREKRSASKLKSGQTAKSSLGRLGRRLPLAPTAIRSPSRTVHRRRPTPARRRGSVFVRYCSTRPSSAI